MAALPSISNAELDELIDLLYEVAAKYCGVYGIHRMSRHYSDDYKRTLKLIRLGLTIDPDGYWFIELRDNMRQEDTMTTQPSRPGETEEFTEAELKRIYDEHVPAEKEGSVSPEELLREGLRKLKQLTPK